MKPIPYTSFQKFWVAIWTFVAFKYLLGEYRDRRMSSDWVTIHRKNKNLNCKPPPINFK